MRELERLLRRKTRWKSRSSRRLSNWHGQKNRSCNLVPCFTPVESPESNGMAEAFVKTFKRDYVRVSPIPDAAAALALVDSWMDDYNTVHPHSRLSYQSPREYILSQPVACPV